VTGHSCPKQSPCPLQRRSLNVTLNLKLDLKPSPDRALVSAAVSRSPAAAIWIASPPAVPLCDRCRPSRYSDFHVGTPPLTYGAPRGYIRI
jgi:hypothetical protein